MTKTRVLLLPLAIVVLATPLSAQRRRADRSGGGAGLHTLVYRGIERHYIVRAPAGVTRTGAKLPVVLVLHGGGGNAENAEKMTGFTRLVERERIIVVYPEGTNGRARLRLETWNAGHCCGYAMRENVDDVGFIDALLDALGTRYPVDQNRLYATGMSNGAMMSHRLGRELQHPLAAIAPVVGAVFGDERPATRPVSALMINGLLDKSVPPQGGTTGGRSENAWDGTPMLPQPAQASYWAKVNDCASEPRKETRGVVVHWRYDCPAGRAVEWYQLGDLGHAWPGGERGSRMGDAPSASMDATAVIWDFFKAHPR